MLWFHLTVWILTWVKDCSLAWDRFTYLCVASTKSKTNCNQPQTLNKREKTVRKKRQWEEVIACITYSISFSWGLISSSPSQFFLLLGKTQIFLLVWGFIILCLWNVHAIYLLKLSLQWKGVHNEAQMWSTDNKQNWGSTFQTIMT